MSQIVEEKGHDVLQIEAEASVHEAVKQMVGERCVVARVGRNHNHHHITPHTQPHNSSLPLIIVTPQTSIDECMALMTDRRIRHLPVVDDRGSVVGIVSIGDVVKFKSKQQSFEIKFLHEYIDAT